MRKVRIPNLYIYRAGMVLHSMSMSMSMAMAGCSEALAYVAKGYGFTLWLGASQFKPLKLLQLADKEKI